MDDLQRVQNPTQEARDLLKTLCLNLSVISNKQGHHNQTVAMSSTALSIEKSAKAYYLRAQAHAKLQSYEEAINDIKEAIKLSPSDKALRDEFENIKNLKKKSLEA